MAYVFSNPWQDAANVGGAIGDRLAQAFIQLPLQRLQLARQNEQEQYQRGIEQQQLGLQRQGLEQKGQYEGQVLDLRRALADNSAEALRLRGQYEQDRASADQTRASSEAKIKEFQDEIDRLKAGAPRVVPAGGQLVDPQTGKVIDNNPRTITGPPQIPLANGGSIPLSAATSIAGNPIVPGSAEIGAALGRFLTNSAPQAQAAPPTINDPSIVVNPQTGQKLKWNGQAWIQIQ